MDWTLSGSSVHGIVQARILAWMSPSSGDHPNPGIEPRSPTLQADSLPSEPPGKPYNLILSFSFAATLQCCDFHLWVFMLILIYIHSNFHI